MKKDRPKSNANINRYFEYIIRNNKTRKVFLDILIQIRNKKMEKYTGVYAFMKICKIPQVYYWRVVDLLDNPQTIYNNSKIIDTGYVGHKNQKKDYYANLYKYYQWEYKHTNREEPQDLTSEDWEEEEHSIESKYPLKIYFSELMTTEDMKRFIDENAVRIRQLQNKYKGKNKLVEKVSKMKFHKNDIPLEILDYIYKNRKKSNKVLREEIIMQFKRDVGSDSVAEIKKRKKVRRAKVKEK